MGQVAAARLQASGSREESAQKALTACNPATLAVALGTDIAQTTAPVVLSQLTAAGTST